MRTSQFLAAAVALTSVCSAAPAPAMQDELKGVPEELTKTFFDSPASTKVITPRDLEAKASKTTSFITLTTSVVKSVVAPKPKSSYKKSKEFFTITKTKTTLVPVTTGITREEIVLVTRTKDASKTVIRTTQVWETVATLANSKVVSGALTKTRTMTQFVVLATATSAKKVDSRVKIVAVTSTVSPMKLVEVTATIDMRNVTATVTGAAATGGSGSSESSQEQSDASRQKMQELSTAYLAEIAPLKTRRMKTFSSKEAESIDEKIAAITSAYRFKMEMLMGHSHSGSSQWLEVVHPGKGLADVPDVPGATDAPGATQTAKLDGVWSAWLSRKTRTASATVMTLTPVSSAAFSKTTIVRATTTIA